MSHTDSIGDFLTRIRNGLQARHKSVEVPASGLKLEVARVLKEEGYITGYRMIEKGVHKRLEVRLKYGAENQPVISTIQRVSRPSRRVYVGGREVPRVFGGEVLCEVW